MGDIISSIFGGGQTTSQKQQTTPDPIAQSMNQLKLDQLMMLTHSGMSPWEFSDKRPDVFSMHGDEALIRGNVMNQSTAPGMSTDEWLNRSMAMVSPAAGNVLSNIAAPAIQNQLSLTGLGRSGAGTEALSRAGMEMALPMAMQLSQMMPQTNVMLRNADMSRAMQGLQVAGMPRELATEDFMRRQGLWQTAMTGIPFSPGSSTNQKGSQTTKSMFQAMFKQ